MAVGLCVACRPHPDDPEHTGCGVEQRRVSSRVHLASPGSPADVDALVALRFTWCHDEGGESGDLESFRPAFAQWWAGHAETHAAFLGDVDGRAAGMAWLGILTRIPGPERFRRLSGVVQSVYVRPEARGHGLGSALVQAVVGHARELGLDYLAVHPSERSYPVYERAGFGMTRSVLELGLTGPRLPA